MAITQGSRLDVTEGVRAAHLLAFIRAKRAVHIDPARCVPWIS
jgi:hypothetical protein